MSTQIMPTQEQVPPNSVGVRIKSALRNTLFGKYFLEHYPGKHADPLQAQSKSDKLLANARNHLLEMAGGLCYCSYYADLERKMAAKAARLNPENSDALIFAGQLSILLGEGESEAKGRKKEYTAARDFFARAKAILEGKDNTMLAKASAFLQDLDARLAEIKNPKEIYEMRQFTSRPALSILLEETRRLSQQASSGQAQENTPPGSGLAEKQPEPVAGENTGKGADWQTYMWG